MKKSDLIEAIALNADISKASAGRAVDAFCTSVSNAMENKDSLQLPGFGTFKTAERSARVGRNPKTGEAIDIAASTSVKFTMASALKEKLNK